VAVKEAAQKQLAFIEQAAAQAGVSYEGIYKVSHAPWEAITEAAKKKKCDLIFMGSHGRSGLAGVLLGSQTTKVLTHSKIPVLVAR
jgi:nucleotide-binding universal stress UspA family protein